MDPQIGWVVAILFVGALLRATFGFGEALFAVPLLSLVVGVRAAAAIVGITSTINILLILSTGWKAVNWRAARGLVTAAILMVPIGALALTRIPEAYVKMFLGVLLLLFALFNLIRPQVGRLASDRCSPLFGAAAGVLGGAYGTLGPPLVVYGTLRGWSADEFRSTIQAIFLPTCIFISLNHYLQRLWTPQVYTSVAFSLPVLLLAAPLGAWFNRRFHGERFTRLVFYLLLLIAGILVVTAIADPGEAA